MKALTTLNICAAADEPYALACIDNYPLPSCPHPGAELLIVLQILQWTGFGVRFVHIPDVNGYHINECVKHYYRYTTKNSTTNETIDCADSKLRGRYHTGNSGQIGIQDIFNVANVYKSPNANDSTNNNPNSKTSNVNASGHQLNSVSGKITYSMPNDTNHVTHGVNVASTYKRTIKNQSNIRGPTNEHKLNTTGSNPLSNSGKNYSDNYNTPTCDCQGLAIGYEELSGHFDHFTSVGHGYYSFTIVSPKVPSLNLSKFMMLSLWRFDTLVCIVVTTVILANYGSIIQFLLGQICASKTNTQPPANAESGNVIPNNIDMEEARHHRHPNSSHQIEENRRRSKDSSDVSLLLLIWLTFILGVYSNLLSVIIAEPVPLTRNLFNNLAELEPLLKSGNVRIFTSPWVVALLERYKETQFVIECMTTMPGSVVVDDRLHDFSDVMGFFRKQQQNGQHVAIMDGSVFFQSYINNKVATKLAILQRDDFPQSTFAYFCRKSLGSRVLDRIRVAFTSGSAYTGQMQQVYKYISDHNFRQHIGKIRQHRFANEDHAEFPKRPLADVDQTPAHWSRLNGRGNKGKSLKLNIYQLLDAFYYVAVFHLISLGVLIAETLWVRKKVVGCARRPISQDIEDSSETDLHSITQCSHDTRTVYPKKVTCDEFRETYAARKRFDIDP